MTYWMSLLGICFALYLLFVAAGGSPLMIICAAAVYLAYCCFCFVWIDELWIRMQDRFTKYIEQKRREQWKQTQ